MTFKDHIDYVVKKLNRFSYLVYKLRHLYLLNYLLLFYNSYAELVIRYGILVYGSAAKTNLEINEKPFRKKVDSLKEQLRTAKFSLFLNCMY